MTPTTTSIPPLATTSSAWFACRRPMKDIRRMQSTRELTGVLGCCIVASRLRTSSLCWASPQPKIAHDDTGWPSRDSDAPIRGR